MRLKILLILFLQVALVESLREVSGYLGDTVTLLSGADPSWNLSAIEWSIFSNSTWIATYQDNRENIERVDRYKGRLILNTTSGDLLIRNLTTEDAMEYNIDLFNTARLYSRDKIKVIVRQRLQKPTIATYASKNGVCRLWLHCHSADEGALLSWQSIPPDATVYNLTAPVGNPGVALEFLNPIQGTVELTCTSCRNMEKTSSHVKAKCDGKTTEPQTTPNPKEQPQTRDRHLVVFVVGGFLGITLIVITICLSSGERHV
ncbi:uncharacterized protein si:cabz01074946.1 [Anoplopoma fimbria]|uniref:uncharacterized protein si:cabz01074946.1 n=1 Tax=Anoplopoma fimbria TaxID=229290 RepID=UPI0023ECB874|nr:uncharacterized protein si:cabz01074946.1 [Anoplopoma fimbria]